MGFTLPELMIALVVISIGAALGFPALRDYREAQRTRAEATTIQAVLNLAKNRAATMNRVVRVDFAPGSLTPSERFFTVFIDQNRDGTLDPGEIAAARLPNTVRAGGMAGYGLSKRIAFGPPAGASTGPLGVPVTADGVTFNGDQVALLPDGTASQAGHAMIRDGKGNAYAITLSVGGAVRVFSYDGTNWK